MTIQFVKRIFRDYTTLLTILPLAIVLSACDTGQDLGGFTADIQAADDSFTVSEDTMFAGNVSTNDSLGGGRTYSLGSGPSNGTVDLSSDGSFTYMPNADFFGTDSFTVNVSYGDGTSGSTTVSLTVENTPDTLEEFGWELVWSDEFDGAALNAANWTPQVGDGMDVAEQDPPLERWGNNEQQWYVGDNIAVADGNLVITARAEEVVAGFPYTSGRMRSKNKVDFKYGRIEARAQAPTGKGLWSAFWMLPTDSPYQFRPDPAGPLDAHWAASGEVDIMEVVNAGTADENVFVTLHHGFPWPLFQSDGTPVDVTAPDGEFHTYAIEWEQGEFRWYVDDVHVLTVGSDAFYSYYYAGQDTGYALGPDGAPFDVDFHIILNLAVGGFLPGDVAPETVFPAEMLVDYVRVYECSADPVTGEGCASFVDESVDEDQPAAKSPFIQSYDLYTDGAGALTWQVGDELVSRDLAVASFFDNNGALLLSEVEAADASRGTVIDVMTADSGNVSVYAQSVVKVNGVPIDFEEPVALFGMGDSARPWELHAGELKFDLHVISANTDVDSSLLIKMDSGFPALGQVELQLADLAQDEWTTVSVKINDLLANPGDIALDLSSVVSLFVLEPTGMAHVQVDNLQLVCGHPGSCGAEAPVSSEAPPPPTGGGGDPVPGRIFVDAADPAWSLFDCCGGSIPSVEDTGDPDFGNAAQYQYLAAATVAGFSANAADGEDLRNFEGGTLEFDLYLATPPNAGADTPWRLKLEGPGGNPALEVGLNESVEGVEPTVGAWQHYTFNLDDLGFDLSAVKLVLVFPTWESSDGAVVWLDNVQFVAPPGQVYMDAPDPAWSLFDCCGGSIPEEVDTGDPERGNVAQYTYLAAATVAGFSANADEGIDLSEFAGGTVEFDVYLATPPNAGADTPWRLKFEQPGGSPAVEVGLIESLEGVEPTVGAWQHYTFNVDDLGFDFSAVKLLLVFPTWESSDGAVVWLDKVRFLKPPAP